MQEDGDAAQSPGAGTRLFERCVTYFFNPRSEMVVLFTPFPRHKKIALGHTAQTAASHCVFGDSYEIVHAKKTLSGALRFSIDTNTPTTSLTGEGPVFGEHTVWSCGQLLCGSQAQTL